MNAIKLLKVLTAACYAVIIVLACGSPLIVKAAAPSYALINPGCVLYSDAALSLPVTTLPESYFVALLEQAELDQTTEQAVRVSYLSLTGFVSADSVTAVDYTPKSKFATASLTLTNDGGTVNIRSAPNHLADNIVRRLTDGATLEYFGTAFGSTQNEIIGNEWYAVRLDGKSVGYVYSMYVSALPFAPNDTSPEPQPELPSLSPEPTVTSPYFLACALSIPVVIVMYLLFKARN